MILIVTPIVPPVVMKFGADRVYFGMIMLLSLGIGLCHPPVGAILFVGCALGPVTTEQIVREIWPFYAVMFCLDAGDLFPRYFIVAAANAVVLTVELATFPIRKFNS